MSRISYEEMLWRRNPAPARGPGIYSLDELRYYVRKFWTDKTYSVCAVTGGKTAFLRACDLTGGACARMLLADPPEQEFMRADTQRRISRAVRNVLTGKIHYESDPANALRAIGVYDPDGVPPEGTKEIPRQLHFRMDRTPLGPRIRRIQLTG